MIALPRKKVVKSWAAATSLFTVSAAQSALKAFNRKLYGWQVRIGRVVHRVGWKACPWRFSRKDPPQGNSRERCAGPPIPEYQDCLCTAELRQEPRPVPDR